MKTTTWINRSAIALALVAAVLGIGVATLGRLDSGVRLAVQGDRIVIAEVLPWSGAATLRTGSIGYATPLGAANPPGWNTLTPGMIVTSLNGRTIMRMPEYVYGNTNPTPDPVTGDYPNPVPSGVDPATPTLAVPPAQLQQLAAEPVMSVYAVEPADLAAWSPNSGAGVGWAVPWQFDGALIGWTVGLLGFLFAAWWLMFGRAGEALRGMAWPLAAAVAAPLLLWPLAASGTPIGMAVVSVLLPVCMLPLAMGLVGAVEARPNRLLGLGAAIAGAACAAALGVDLSASGLYSVMDQALVLSLLVGAVTFIPALLAAGAWRARQSDGGEAERRVVAGASLAAAGATPFFAVQSAIGPFGLALPLWLLALAVASRVTIRPLTRLANRAHLQRDLVVAATEAERARVAADIHDDALQELTLLVRRLDTAGDTEGAEIARGVSDRLRAICGDLRLPILDDLGVGPALDWLVLRMERIAGGSVALDRAEGARPPADVELAIFRVAQEALANAVKHGATPITVRYRSAEGSASLAVDDAGAGIDPGAAEKAAGDGRFGLLNMAQRAEAIGAILDVRRWPGGGTHVQLEWRAK
jgi:signal transduction histidine kinase